MKTIDKKAKNRASQTNKSDSTKVETKAKAVAPKVQPKVWAPPSYLDTPNAPNGYRHRWVRVEILGFVDTKNVQGRLRSGYELVRADEYPKEDFPVVQDGKYAGVIGHGGLVLTRVPEEIARQRTDYYMNQAQDQMKAIDNDLMKEQHKGMPIDIDRQSRTTFGGKE
jgi:hypothetical protein|tara:strand:+ start:1059 stop:1559 length:501 start_codon:yes stop_codon:yes gene_type:complete